MKKILVLLTLILSTALTFTACKKDEKTAKEQTLELLTTGKWYYQSFKQTNTSSASINCFNATNYWEFKPDGSFDETWDLGSGTYSLNEDGKNMTISIKIGNNTVNYPATITSITEATLTFSIKVDDNSYAEFNLGKTAKTCNGKL